MVAEKIEYEKRNWSDLTDGERTDCLNLTEKFGAMRSFVQSTSPECFLAVENGVIVAWSVFDVKSKYHMLYVHSLRRRRGIGSALTKMAREYAFSKGVRKMTVFPVSGKRGNVDYFRKSIGLVNTSIGEIQHIHPYLMQAYEVLRPKDNADVYYCKITGKVIDYRIA